MRATVALIAVLAGLLAPSAAAAAPSSMSLGFLDGAFAGGAERDVRLDEAAALGSSIVRVPTGWAGLSPTRPARPEDPADPAYDWASLDDAVRAADARGLRVLVSLTGAPAWAEGPGRPSDANPGTWRPNSTAFGRFATALGKRYSGRYPDPRGGTLPRAYAFQPWNEPNLTTYLAPQWVRRGGKYVAEGPRIYRALQAAFYRGVKAGAPAALVVTAGTSPFGNPEPGGTRMQPARFWREVLCLSRSLSPRPCPDPARFDALSHHPYAIGGPFRRAQNTDDVTVPDLTKLDRIVRRAVATGRALPRARKRLWVTEISWDSRPPDPEGVPQATHANWLQDALYVLWEQGVDTVTWFQVRDKLPEPSYAFTSQSGVLLADGSPKLAARAFRMPISLRRPDRRGRTLVFGRAAKAGTMFVQRAAGGKWRTIAGVQMRRDQVLARRVPAKSGDRIRLVLGQTVSLVRSVPR